MLQFWFLHLPPRVFDRIDFIYFSRVLVIFCCSCCCCCWCCSWCGAIGVVGGFVVVAAVVDVVVSGAVELCNSITSKSSKNSIGLHVLPNSTTYIHTYICVYVHIYMYAHTYMNIYKNIRVDLFVRPSVRLSVFLFNFDKAIKYVNKNL